MKKQWTQRFREAIIEIVYTDYGSVEEKEDRLRRRFDRHDYIYGREAVKDIVMIEYQSKGGYNSREVMTAWIFAES